jgi:hypothetical protein
MTLSNNREKRDKSARAEEKRELMGRENERRR